jgi:zinc protease
MRTLLLLLSLSVASSAFAQLVVTPPRFAVDESKLPNGLTLLVHEDHSAPTVTVNLWYHVGSKDDPPGKSGFAHLFEHVMFQGSKHVAEDTFFKLLQGAGGTNLNGTTNVERTNFFETVPKNRLELALWLESDRMGFLLDHANQATFVSQRDVVKSERRQNYENQPYGLVRGFMNEAYYPLGHPLRELTIGKPEDLDRAQLTDVQAFFRSFYGPNNATLVLAGDITAAEAKPLVEKWFGPIPAVKVPARRAIPEVTLSREVRLDVEAGVQAPQVRVWWPTPKLFAPGDAELDLLAATLTGGPSARLTKALVETLQIAQGVSCGQQSGAYGSTFDITATALPGHTAQELLNAIDAVLAEVAGGPCRDSKACQGALTAAEVERASASYQTSFVFGVESVSNRADAFNAYHERLGVADGFERDFVRYQQASLAAVQASLAKWLPKDKRLVTFITPNSAAPAAGRLVVKESK